MSGADAAPFAGRTLRLLPLALQTQEISLLSWLGSALAGRTGLLPVQEPPHPLDRAALDPARGQYSSNHLVDALISRDDGAADGWTLALTNADLFAPGRDFVFGEAALGGAWAVLSLARLDHPGSDEGLLRHRLLVEALHELGHLAGLGHCHHPVCAMRRAALACDVDRKEPAFCPDCRRALSGSRGDPSQDAPSNTLDR